MESIQAALKQAEQDNASTSVQKNEQTTKPKAAVRKSSHKKSKGKSPSEEEETTFIKKIAQEEKNALSTSSKLAPTFGILRSVQALMNKNDESQFSQSVVGGHSVSTPVKSNSDTFDPAVHSTAVKKHRGPVENEDVPSASGSTIRKARPLPRFGAKQTDEEAIPMVKISRSKPENSRIGTHNPAFVADA